MNEDLDDQEQVVETVTNMVLEDGDGDQGSFSGSIMRYRENPSKSFPFFGKMVYDQGDVYEGGWKEGKFHGNGNYLFGDGECYDGEWEDGKIVRGIWYSNYHHYQLQDDPEAAKFYNNPSITKKIKRMRKLEEEGENNGKKRKRKDSEQLRVPVVFEGNFVTMSLDGRIGGEIREVPSDGISYFSDGRFYKGEVVNFEHLPIPPNNIEWKEIHGYGEFFSPSNGGFDMIRGYFKEGLVMCGEDVVIEWPDGESYKGNLKNFQKHGLGHWKLDGIEYIGEFKKDKGHGKGTQIFHKVKSKNHPNNHFSEATSSSYQQQVMKAYKSSVSHEGNYQSDKMNGEGKLVFMDGSEFHAVWDEDEIDVTEYGCKFYYPKVQKKFDQENKKEEGEEEDEEGVEKYFTEGLFQVEYNLKREISILPCDTINESSFGDADRRREFGDVKRMRKSRGNLIYPTLNRGINHICPSQIPLYPSLYKSKNFVMSNSTHLQLKNIGVEYQGEIDFDTGRRNGFGRCFLDKQKTVYYMGRWKDDQPHNPIDPLIPSKTDDIKTVSLRPLNISMTDLARVEYHKLESVYLGSIVNGMWDGYGIYCASPDLIACDSSSTSSMDMRRSSKKRRRMNGNESKLQNDGKDDESKVFYYEGGWKENKRDGLGLCIFKNGSTLRAEWKEDIPSHIHSFIQPSSSPSIPNQKRNLPVEMIEFEGEVGVDGVVCGMGKISSLIIKKNLGVIERKEEMLFEGNFENGIAQNNMSSNQSFLLKNEEEKKDDSSILCPKEEEKKEEERMLEEEEEEDGLKVKEDFFPPPSIMIMDEEEQSAFESTMNFNLDSPIATNETIIGGGSTNHEEQKKSLEDVQQNENEQKEIQHEISSSPSSSQEYQTKDVGSLSEDEMIAQEVREILNIMIGVVNSSLEAEEKEKENKNSS